MDFVQSLGDEDEWGMERSSSRCIEYFDAVTALTNTFACIRTFGWVPRSGSDEDNFPTAEHVFYIMTVPFTAVERERHRKFIASVKFEPQHDLDQAKAAIEWLRQQPGDNEYLHNLKLLEDQDRVPAKMMGYWCSLAAAYQRAMDTLERAKRTKKISEHFGEIKQRIETQVKCVGINYTDGYYGTICIHRMLTTEGHTIVWFANADAKMVRGGHYKIRATIKKHDEYQDWKQTHVSRLQVIEELQKEEEKQ